ncbi:protein of unknown function [Paraburkholderia kururiensis]|uniref:hypothetical protein n=1 Tax=Paraburkholderia kururiensis TaxID=984307 RepID=UPI0039A77C6D
MVRAEIAFNGKARPLVWSNVKLCRAIDEYLVYRRVARHGVTTAPAAYRGLDPHGSLFRASDGEPFTFTRRVTGSGTISYSCETLTEIVRRLHYQAGIEGGNASAARRSFAVQLHRQGRSLKLIQTLIGVSSLSAVKSLIEADPVRLATIVSGVI